MPPLEPSAPSLASHAPHDEPEAPFGQVHPLSDVHGQVDALRELLGRLYRPHPWHGVSLGKNAPDSVTVYVELVPSDTLKYEVDKRSGYLRIDRPQRYSSVCPTVYGMLPRTYCGSLVGAFSAEQSGREELVGDGDPLDVCVLTEQSVTHGDLLLEAIPIGGLRLIDRDEADDKIIAVLKDDGVYGSLRDLSECPPPLLERLRHYFLTYKDVPGGKTPACEIAGIYGREEAHEVIRRSREDYQARFGDPEELFAALVKRANGGAILRRG